MGNGNLDEDDEQCVLFFSFCFRCFTHLVFAHLMMVIPSSVLVQVSADATHAA